MGYKTWGGRSSTQVPRRGVTAKARGVSELFMIWCLPVWVPGTVRLSDASRVMKEPGAIIRCFPGHGEPGAIIRCFPGHAGTRCDYQMLPGSWGTRGSFCWSVPGHFLLECARSRGARGSWRARRARRVMGNPVQFTCRRTARARTARAGTAGTRNTSMGSATL